LRFSIGPTSSVSNLFTFVEQSSRCILLRQAHRETEESGDPTHNLPAGSPTIPVVALTLCVGVYVGVCV
jgi:hypothetical protein